MLSITRFDLIAAAFFIIGCGLLFCVRYIGTRITNQQPTHNERNHDEQRP